MHRQNRRLLLLAFATSLILSLTPAQAADLPPETPKTQALGPLAYKVDARLISLLDALHAGTADDALAAQTVKGAHGRALANAADPKRLAIRIDAQITADLTAAVRATGATIVHVAPQWNTISATATITQIDALSRIGGIRTIMLQAGKRRHQQGTTPNAADPLMNTDNVRSAFKVTGAGQTVGVMSDSVIDTNQVALRSTVVTGTPPNAIVSGTVPQQTGDLPSSFQLVDPGPGMGSDEGEAMMELIYDVAPGAALAFASAENDQEMAASNFLLLRTAANCTIIVDDIGFIDEPYFQDGPMAQAMNTNTAAGTIHFSALGNDGTNGVNQTFTPVNPGSTSDDMANPPSGKDFHNWGIQTSTPAFLPIQLSAGDELTVVLQWNQPFASHNLGAGSEADLDMYLYSKPAIGKNPLASANQPQGTAGNPRGDPLEIIDYINKGQATTVYLVINHHQGVRNNFMRMVFSDTNLNFTFPSGGVNGQSAYGHPTTRNCISVAAMDAVQIQAGNLAPESFTSEGGWGANGIPYFFDTSGNPLPGAPVLVNAPVIAAPDDVNTSFFQMFQGTSCAAPNAAAAGALLRQASPATSLATLTSSLESSARAVSTTPPNAFTGGGLIDAKALFATLVKPPSITSPVSATGNVASFFNYTTTATGSQPITYSAIAVPPGLSSNANIISGLPTSSGTFNMQVTAVNGAGSANQTVAVTIAPRVAVQILSQVGATPNPAAAGTAVAFSVSAVSDTLLPLSFKWNFGDSSAAGSGVSPSHTYNMPGTFVVSVTASDGTVSVLSNVTVVVSGQPQFTSPPTATPPAPSVGQTVTFAAAAIEGTVPLTYAWDFGDGGSGSGATVTHSYAAAGSYTATVTASDSNGNSGPASVTVNVKAPLVGFGNDSDGDGFSDDFETAAGTDPHNAASTPLGGASAASAEPFVPLTATKLTIKLNLVKTGADSISFSGTLPIPAGFNALGQKVTLDVNGVDAGFTLDPRGNSQKGSPKTFKLQFRSAGGAVSAQTARYTVRLMKGSFAQVLSTDAGLGNTPGTSKVKLVLSIVFNGAVYQTPAPLTYTVAKNGKTGTAK